MDGIVQLFDIRFKHKYIRKCNLKKEDWRVTSDEALMLA
jgi:hypothetical protein